MKDKEPKVKKEKPIKEKKIKEKGTSNVALAKLLVFILIMIVFGVSVLKFIDILSKPKVLFDSVMSDTYNGLNTIFEELTNERIYKLINDKAVNIKGNTKINIDSQSNIEYTKYKDAFDKLSINTNINYDKNSNYLDINILGNINDESKLNITYLNKDYSSYMDLTNLYNKYLLIDTKSINYEALDPLKTLTLFSILRNDSSNTIKDENFKSNNETLVLGNGAVDCNVSYYELTGAELNTILDAFINTVVSRDDTSSYLLSLYGGKKDALRDTLINKKKDLNINDDYTYVIKAYTALNNDASVMLSFEGENSKISYKMYDNKKEIVYNNKKDSTNFVISLNTLSKTFSLNYTVNGEKYILGIDKNIYKFKYINKESKELGLELTFKVKYISSTTAKISVKANGTYSLGNANNMPISIDSEFLVNQGVDINKKSALAKPTLYSTLSSTDKESIKTNFDSIIDEVNNTLIEGTN